VSHEASPANDYDVIVVGAGPVGLTLSIDLGRRDVRCLLMEREPSTAPWPKMDRSNARTMEIYRRLGLADRVRALGYPPDNPMDIVLARTLNEPAVAVQPFPSVAERREQIAACTDGTLPLEPYQLVSQNTIEPLLREVAEQETPNTTVRYGLELVDFEQDDSGVTVRARTLDDKQERFRCAYLVGSDGGASTVRKQLGVKLEGRAAFREIRQVIFRSADLYERMVITKGRHYHFVDHDGGLVVHGDRKEMSYGCSLPADTDFEAHLRDLIGFDCDLKVTHVTTWRPHLLVAEKFRVGRTFMAGDAVHLVIPTGGLGMNTGIGDAIDLSWKLAGVINGWGGEGLLDGYELERRPVAKRNVEASGWAADGQTLFRGLAEHYVESDGAAGRSARERLVTSFLEDHGRMHGMVGVETCYSYAGSPLVVHEPGNRPFWEISRIEPHGRPGIRIPHVWLKDGTALQDVLGYDYTLLDLTGDCDTTSFAEAFRSSGAPLQVIKMDEPHLRDMYKGKLFLIRPDLHIAWRGDAPPVDAHSIVAIATGHGPPYRA
jgi:2-polyprenyl-6-methoxyphenol hydroxylase-like FAD-dependent oxidoreductase